MYKEIEEHLLNDKKPSDFLRTLDIFKHLEDTPQSPKHHPEGNVWNHTLLVVDEAASRRAKSRDPRAFMWAALLHDIGKPAATKMRNGKLTAYGHDQIGGKLSYDFLQSYDANLAHDVSALVRWHMQILFVAQNKPFADIKAMKSQVDVNEIALLGLCDRLGRGNVNAKAERENIELFLKKIRD